MKIENCRQFSRFLAEDPELMKIMTFRIFMGILDGIKTCRCNKTKRLKTAEQSYITVLSGQKENIFFLNTVSNFLKERDIKSISFSSGERELFSFPASK